MQFPMSGGGTVFVQKAFCGLVFRGKNFMPAESITYDTESICLLQALAVFFSRLIASLATAHSSSV